MAEYYLVIKAFHLVSVIAWMAGLLYLPRLFVYHVDAKKGGELDKTLQIMERKLLRYIMNPAMIASIVFGVLLLVITKAGAPGSGVWMHLKLLCIFILAGTHGMMAVHRKAFERGQNAKSMMYYKILNEIPTVLMAIIVFLVILKPF